MKQTPTPARLPFIWRDELCPAPNTRTYFKRIVNWRTGMPTQIGFAADPTASLWVNGTLVLDRTQRFVAPHIPIESLDLAPVLRTGANVIVVLHHWWGVKTFQRAPGGRPGVAITSRWLRTDAHWHWCDAAEYPQHPFQTIGHDGAQRIRFPVLIDMRNESAELHAASLDLHKWKSAQEVSDAVWGSPVLKETPALEMAPVPAQHIVSCGLLEEVPQCEAFAPYEVGKQMKAMRHSPQGSAIAAVPRDVSGAGDTAGDRLLPLQLVADSGYLCLDFAQPVHGFLQLDVYAPTAGTVLRIGYCELETNPRCSSPILAKDGSFDPEFTMGSPSGDSVVLRQGWQQVLIHDERTWRWLLLHWEGAGNGVIIEKLHCLSSQHPVCLYGGFHADDEALAPLVRQCLIHARITMSDAYVDTTGREDAQWLEDIQYRARLAASWFGDAALRQVTLRHSAEQQDPHSGLFRVFAPESYGELGCQFLDWGMAWVGMLYDDWQWTGTTNLIERYLPTLELFIDGVERWTGTDDLLTGENCLCDLRTSDRACYAIGGVESIPNACFYGTLRNASAMASAVGAVYLAMRWGKRAESIRTHFTRFITAMDGCGAVTVAETWDPVAGAAGFGQAAVVNAAFYGLLDEDAQRATLLAAFTEPSGLPPVGMKAWNTPTYIYRLLRVLCESGLGELARDHLFYTYAPYLPHGPLPEYFQPGVGQPSDPTGSHGWAAVPLAWLHDTVLGVGYRLPAKAGDRGCVIVRPLYAGWPQVSGTVMTPAGAVNVRVDWQTMDLRVVCDADVAIDAELAPHCDVYFRNQN